VNFPEGEMVSVIQGKAPPNLWTARGRWVVFVLAASSIVCLLADFYGLCPMNFFAAFIFLPSLLALGALAFFDRRRGDGRLWRAVSIGLLGGLLAAVAYDVFRLPFVFARELGIDHVVPPMDLFKVFPRFGAMVLGQAVEQASYPLTTQLVGWIYHFSNGATFGVMYMAMIGGSVRRGVGAGHALHALPQGFQYSPDGPLHRGDPGRSCPVRHRAGYFCATFLRLPRF
jgi:hypothetical protein